MYLIRASSGIYGFSISLRKDFGRNRRRERGPHLIRIHMPRIIKTLRIFLIHFQFQFVGQRGGACDAKRETDALGEDFHVIFVGEVPLIN